jgi:MFS family permease
MVAEVVPEKRRVEAGALLYTSAPVGLFLATFVTYQVSGVLFKGTPETSWRLVFLAGLIPAVVAFIVRFYVKEPEKWKDSASRGKPPSLSELFSPQMRALTLSGFLMAVVALITWWSCNAFISVVAKGLAQVEWTKLTAAGVAGLPSMEVMGQQWVKTATNMFNLGGLIAPLLTIPAAKGLGRRNMFLVYFAGSAIALMAAFGLDLEPHTRLYMYFPIGLTTYGIFGAFTFYLPELFPTRLRGTGAGFTYNIGRLFAAVGPFVVGSIAASGANALDRAINVLFWVGAVPILGLLTLPLVIETKGRTLED